MYIILYLPMLKLAKASDTQLVGHWFEPRPDH